MVNKIKKGDKVQVVAGKDRVKRTATGEKMDKTNQGKVLRVLRTTGRVVVEGLNLRIKHLKPKRAGEKGQRISFPAAMDVSNVMLVCPKCSHPVRVGFKLMETDKKSQKKVRICRHCNEVID